VEELIKCLVSDPSFTVRIYAGIAINFLVRNEIAEGKIRAFLPQIFESLLKLSDKFTNDDILSSIDKLVSVFPSEITPFARDIIVSLSRTFLRTAEEARDGDEEDFDYTAMASIESLSAMNSVVDSLSDHAEVLLTFADPIVDVMAFVFAPNSKNGTGRGVHVLVLFLFVVLEFIAEALELYAGYTYAVPQITDRMWDVYPAMVDALLKWAELFIEGKKRMTDLPFPHSCCWCRDDSSV